jgi:hypothetical protein
MSSVAPAPSCAPSAWHQCSSSEPRDPSGTPLAAAAPALSSAESAAGTFPPAAGSREQWRLAAEGSIQIAVVVEQRVEAVVAIEAVVEVALQAVLARLVVAAVAVAAVAVAEVERARVVAAAAVAAVPHWTQVVEVRRHSVLEPTNSRKYPQTVCRRPNWPVAAPSLSVPPRAVGVPHLHRRDWYQSREGPFWPPRGLLQSPCNYRHSSWSLCDKRRQIKHQWKLLEELSITSPITVAAAADGSSFFLESPPKRLSIKSELGLFALLPDGAADPGLLPPLAAAAGFLSSRAERKSSSSSKETAFGFLRAALIPSDWLN